MQKLYRVKAILKSTFFREYLQNTLITFFFGWHLLVSPKKFKFTPKRLPPKKLFGHQQNLTIPVNLIFNPNYKILSKFSESIIKLMKKIQLNF